MTKKRLIRLFFVGAVLLEPLAAQTKLLALQRYEFGRSRLAWNELEMQLRDPLQREREAGEGTLITILRASESTTDARILACRGLRYVGGSESVQILLSFVRDSRLSQEVCMALQEKESPDINPLLREALPLVENALKRQVMATLGRRRDVDAVPGIVAIAKAIKDQGIQESAIHALGQIGGKQALAGLSEMTVEGSLESARSHSKMLAAVHALEGEAEDVRAGLSMLRRLAVDPSLGSIRFAALYEWAKHDESERVALCRQSLTSRDHALLEIAPKLFVLLDRDAKRDLYGDFFAGLSVPAKTLLVDLWEPEFRNEEALRALSLDISGDPALRAASLRAVERFHE